MGEKTSSKNELGSRGKSQISQHSYYLVGLTQNKVFNCNSLNKKGRKSNNLEFLMTFCDIASKALNK